jgi:NADPH2:quinone reductase
LSSTAVLGRVSEGKYPCPNLPKEPCTLRWPAQSNFGVFTLLPLITDEGRAHHGEILAQITALVETGKLKPPLNDHLFSVADIDRTHARVESGSVGKVVVDLGS